VGEEFGAEGVAADPGVEEGVGGEFGLGGGIFEELLECGTQVVGARVEHGGDHHGSDFDEECFPEGAGLVEQVV